MELFGIAIGLLVFATCLAGAVYYVRARGKVQAVSLAAIGILGLVPLIMVLPAFNTSVNTVAGTYQGYVGGFQQTIDLKPDGSFEQFVTVPGGTYYTNRGTWKLDGWARDIDFDHFIVADFSGRDEKPQVCRFSGATRRPTDGAIVFDDDNDEHIDKIK